MIAAINKLTKTEQEKYSVYRLFHAFTIEGKKRPAILMDIRKLYIEEIDYLLE